MSLSTKMYDMVEIDKKAHALRTFLAREFATYINVTTVGKITIHFSPHESDSTVEETVNFLKESGINLDERFLSLRVSFAEEDLDLLLCYLRMRGYQINIQ